MTRENTRPFVIVGGGVAAAEAAKTLRTEGYGGSLVVVAAEPHAPYDRPPLSKDYLRGETNPEKLVVLDDALMRDPGIELLTGRSATALDVAARVVDLDDGRRIRFDKLLLATGARARVPHMPGVASSATHVLRTIDDADRLREAARRAERAVVVGGGWIGAETTASLRQLGMAVTLVLPGREVLERHVGAEVARRFTAVHEQHGVELVRASRVAEIVDGPRRGVRLEDGTLVAGDLVVLGLGAIPNDDLAAGAGLVTADGVLVDEYLRTASPHVFAAGDVASAWHPAYREWVRSEHWDNARRQGRAAARTMTGAAEPYARLPFLYSDQWDLGIELLGRPAGWDEVLVREIDGRSFVALWLNDGRVVAGMHANTWDAKKPLDALVSSGARIDRDRFADSDVPLADLMPVSQAA
jgi:3-phenylpropionate/trans-cinnamate dioxygenase ferredoxin reductase subunit